MPQPLSESGADLHQQMTEMMFGYCVSQIIRTVADLSLADHLAAGPLTAQEIAEREGSAPATTVRLMRACATFGLVTTDESGRFHGTALLDTLRKFILHDWDDESCVKILRTCRQALEPDGRIAIFELVVDDEGKDSLGVLMDLTMLTVVNGRERTLSEFDALLQRAGLRRTALLTADSPQGVIEAVAA